jgi:hypothetical protein
MKVEDKRTCSVCGTMISANMEFCPVCVLRRGLGEAPKSDESSSENASLDSSPAILMHRFEHYELVKGADGKPIELGRGAMGVTYKAFDIDLHCFATLKVISETCLGEESARLRFLREARAAASIRHPNVASVFHLGRTGQIILTQWLGVTGTNGCRTADSHCGRSAFYSDAGWAVFNSHSRTRSIRGANLLQTRRVLMSLPQSSAAPVFHTDWSMALFSHDRQAQCNDGRC